MDAISNPSFNFFLKICPLRTVTQDEHFAPYSSRCFDEVLYSFVDGQAPGKQYNFLPHQTVLFVNFLM